MTVAHTRVWRKGVLEADGFPMADVSDHLAETDTVVWVDLCRATREELEALAVELSLHDLAVEDALGEHQRSKLDHYESHSFLACYSLRLNEDDGTLENTEIDAFINDRWLITVRKDDGFAMDDVMHRWDRSPELLAHGVSFLLYGLLDVVVDDYFDVVEGFDAFYDRVSEGIFADQPLDPGEWRNWFEVRRSLVRFHKIVVPLRETVSSLMRKEPGALPPEMSPYYQDLYDHILRVTESTDALRDLVATIVETNLSLRDYRQNQAMKKVTGWAAIIAVPTLITGWYGMNVPYPGLGKTWGVVFSALLIVVASGGLYLSFRKRDWL